LNRLQQEREAKGEGNQEDDDDNDNWDDIVEEGVASA
jgi:hypothetical protein